ncbi:MULTISPECIES: LacI family DNA-binding transcriptional regulator [Paenarthrobacter]|uniref:LacI family DNA-binding transcriptional regulator n=1 Tax=Paenarthrobacter TaxID=1742992 RepID=UPI0016680895|nr:MULTISPECIES: LacI family DNA-binding transcriptional regulator [Paenarthrobacter]MBP2393218.1 LacI family transcriptional regulator [Paenarthrobacter nicotinovorans]QOT22027.1 LacI family DNA-binding transcriptional regulator [Paenarthrobacter sp. YJN-D]UKF00512.1 LacI family transcriptional regulator [Paenarthrobacter nicotinovorans]UKF05294.1 LacI family transcriptional regulator [Paenarthrobacter nicotinovorans]GGV31178.1 LacI family transcriptional regulator [Paenarthrobacter nicotinov
MAKASSTGVRPTIRMVAELAGVSTATVSYVLSGRRGDGGPGVSDPTAEKVKAAAERLGYRPNQAARAIRTGRTNTVILSLTMLSDPWSLSVIEAVQKAAVPLGITPMILGDADWVKVLGTHNADAVFVDAVRENQRDDLRKLAERGTTLVVFDEVLEADGFDVIRSIAGPGCRMAVEHLLHGHRQIACLTPAMAAGTSGGSRYRAYSEALASAGIPERQDYVGLFDGTTASAYAAATRLLSLPDRPTAIYATTDYAAVSAINAAQRLGLGVGVDVDIIGVGNTVEGERMSPSLSTVGPVDFFDKLARRLLKRAASHGEHDEPAVLDFPWHLFVRESAPHRSTATRLY